MFRSLLAMLALLALLGCPGGGGKPGPSAGPPPGGGGPGGGPAHGNNPVQVDEFTYPAASQGRYGEGVQEFYRTHPRERPGPNKAALIARHLALAEANYDRIAGSKVAIVHPGGLTDREILSTRLEAAHPQPASADTQERDFALGPIQVHLRARPYEYRDSEAYVDFANRRIGGAVMSYGFVQEEILILESTFLPWVAAVRARPHDGASFARQVSLKNLDTRPVVIKLRRFLEMAHQDEIYGTKLEAVTPFDPQRYLRLLPQPVDIYVPAMAAYNFKHGFERAYTDARIAALTEVATRAFYDTLLAQDRDRKPLVIHTGNWGCGVYGNNQRSIWAIQRVAIEAAYLLFRRTTGQAPPVEFYYDAYDQAGLEEANRACDTFTGFPERLTVDAYVQYLFALTASDSAWQARP